MPTPTEPRLRWVHRIWIDRSDTPRIGRAQLRWVLTSTAVAILAGAFLPSMRLDLLCTVALCLGAVFAHPLPIWRSVIGSLAALLVVQLLAAEGSQALSMSSWAIPPEAGTWSDITGTQLIAASGILGLSANWHGTEKLRGWRAAHGALLAVILGGLGWTLSLQLWPSPSPTHTLAWIVTTSTLVSSSLWIQLFGPSRSSRIPSRRTIEKTLEPQYRPPCLEALRLDDAIEAECEDRDCREGLGEVAAWVYRLQWVLQRMDRELDSSRHGDLETRLQRAEDALEASSDPFARERRRATLNQLHRLQTHLERIHIERDRALALVDFAMVNLEEARAQLILAKLQPGSHAPPSVHDVLNRLRTWSQEQQAEHSSRREIAVLA